MGANSNKSIAYIIELDRQIEIIKEVSVDGGATWHDAMRMDPASGEVLWTVTTKTRGGMVPSPVARKDLVFAFGGGGDGFAIRFDPAVETFTSYPSPTRVTFLRDLVFSEDGAVCSSQSNLPAYAIEGGLPGFICIHP